MDECYRVLEPGGKFRIIVPLFPSLQPSLIQTTSDSLLKIRYSLLPITLLHKTHFGHDHLLSRTLYVDLVKLEQYWSPPTAVSTGHNYIDIDALIQEGRELRATLTNRFLTTEK